MKELHDYPTEELQQTEQVYVTIAQEVERTDVTSDKDKIQFNNLIDEARKMISNHEEINNGLAEQLNYQLDLAQQEPQAFIEGSGGVVLYLTPEEIYYYRLRIPVESKVVIDDVPHILPLVEDKQLAQRYFLMTLSGEDMRLFRGVGAKLTKIEFNDGDAPETIEKGLGGEPKGGELNFGSHGGPEGGAGFHGHHEVSAEKEKQRNAYFKIIDDYVYVNYVRDAKLPLLVFGLAENIAAFRKLSTNEFLSDFEIERSPSGLSDKELEKIMEKVILDITDTKRRQLFDQFNETTPEFTIDEQYDDLAYASLEGRIESLIIQKGLTIPGTITDEGRHNPDSDDNDYINRLVMNILQANGDVYVFNEEQMPAGIRIKARLRY